MHLQAIMVSCMSVWAVSIFLIDLLKFSWIAWIWLWDPFFFLKMSHHFLFNLSEKLFPLGLPILFSSEFVFTLIQGLAVAIGMTWFFELSIFQFLFSTSLFRSMLFLITKMFIMLSFLCVLWYFVCFFVCLYLHKLIWQAYVQS